MVENDNVSAESLASTLLTFKTLSTCDEGVEAIVNCGGLDSSSDPLIESTVMSIP